jgi:hypothetical protein
MSKPSPKQPAPTIWTAAVTSVAVLQRLDMRAPAAGHASARKRAAAVKKEIDRDLAPYAHRSPADSLRKRVR